MEPVKADYKKTEVGSIPKDWNTFKLNSIGQFYKGKGIKKDEVSPDGFKCIRYGELYTHYNNVIKAVKSHIPKEVAAISFKTEHGDILFAGSGETREEIGKSAALLTTEIVYAGGDIVILRPRNYDPKLLGYLLNANIIAKQKALRGQGDAVVHIYPKGLGEILVPLPPTLTEQKAIADALSDVDALIASLEKLIAKKKAIKQGAMQALLTPPHKGGKRLEGFSGEWKEVRLGDCLKYEQPTKYLVRSNEYEGKSQIPVLTAGKSFLLGYTDEDFGIYENLPVIIFDDFTTSNQFVNFKFKVKSSAMKMLTPTSREFDITFLYALMNTLKYSLGDEHKRRWIAEYSKIKIYVPGIKEQTAITQILNDLEDEITSLKSELSKHSAIKQGMMQELLTGKTRLV